MVCLALMLLGCKADEPDPGRPDTVEPSEGKQDKVERTVDETVEPDSDRITPLEGQQLPKIADGTQIPEGIVVYASMTELTFNGEVLAALQSGVPSAEAVQRHVILPLRDQLEANVAAAYEDEWDGRMLLAFDARVPFSTVVDALYTGGRAGFTNYAFIVASSASGERALIAAPPRYPEGAQPQPPKLKVFIGANQLDVMLPGEGEPRELAKLDPAGSGAEAWDQAGLALIVDEFLQANAGASTAVVSAENDTPLGVLLGTCATLTGPGCDQAEPKTCRLPNLIIEAGAG